MRTKEAIKTELEWLDTKIKLDLERRKQVEQELAECLAEFKVCQRVIQSYAGKSDEYEIDSVYLWTSSQVRYRARKVLKSGQLHKNTQELYGTLKLKEVSE